MIDVGTGKANLTFQDGHGLFGFGPLGGRGLNVPEGSREYDVLQARALFLCRGSMRLLVIGLDLSAGSEVIQSRLHAVLAQDGYTLAREEILIVGTHTHAAPGEVFGTFYDWFGQYPSLRGELAISEIVAKARLAARAAMETTTPCKLGVAERTLWGPGRNRSMRAFLRNFDGHDPRAWNEELRDAKILPLPPEGATPEQRAIDPRLTVVAFVDATKKVVATWGTWCCHPATFRRAPERPYHRDWPGVAVDALEKSGASFAMMHMRSNGDVTPLPSGDLRVADPVRRVHELGEAVAGAWRDALADAVAGASGDAELAFAHHAFSPADAGLPEFEVGASVLVGSEEYDPQGLLTRSFFGEARTISWRHGAQGPKLPALGPLQWLVRAALPLRPSATHPLWLLRLANHVFFVSPFEQTTYAARTAEKQLVAAWARARSETVTASPIGLAGDYAGYVTTPAEYEAQNYEGGHTLYGPGQLDALIAAWTKLIPLKA